MAIRAGTRSGPHGTWRAGTTVQATRTVSHGGSGASTENGGDTGAGTGFRNPTNSLQQYGVDPATLRTTSDSLGSQLVGTATSADRWLLPTVYADGTITWELDGSGNATGRIQVMTGTGDAIGLPYRYWNGTAWLSNTFNTQGASLPIFGVGASVEGGDTSSGTGSVPIRGDGASVEDADTSSSSGGVSITGGGASTEGSDSSFGAGTVTGRIGPKALHVSAIATEPAGTGGPLTYYIGNTNELWILGLSLASGAHINDADAEVSMATQDGAAVGGATWPLAMEYATGSDGDYVAVLPHSLEVVAGTAYRATIRADAPDGSVYRSQHLIAAKVRGE